MLLLAPMLAALVQLQTSPALADPPIDPCDSVVISQTRAALGDLRASALVHGGVDPVGQVVVYEGTVSFEGHLMKPGMVRVLPYRIEITIDASAHVVAVHETINPATRPSIETTLIDGKRVASQTSGEGPFKELDAPVATASRAENSLWFPSSALAAALEAAASCRPGPAIDAAGQPLKPITFTEASGRACTLLLDSEHRLARIERLNSHQRLGDVCEWTSFTQWKTQDGVAVPGHLARFVVLDSSTTRYDVSLVSFHRGAIAADAGRIPSEHRDDVPSWGARESSGMEWVSIAPHLWSLEIEASDSRVLVAEREKDLVVIGAPDGDAVCTALVREAALKFPAKPIGTATFGHHHPAYTGGLRALSAAGATILAPRELEPFLRELLARPTSLGLPAMAGPKDPKIDLFDGDTTIPFGDHEIRLINIGDKSAHTFQYVVFYFENEGVLAEDDLGYFALKGATRAGPRLMGLADVLDNRGIVPKRLIQLWPVKSVQREVEWSSVADLVQAERKKALEAKPGPR